MIKLSCNSCGAKLEVTEDIERFSCASCGSEWIVQRSGGIVSLKSVEEGIQAISDSTEILAADVKIRKLQEMVNTLRVMLQNLKQEKTILRAQQPSLMENPEWLQYDREYGPVRKMWMNSLVISFAIFSVITIMLGFNEMLRLDVWFYSFLCYVAACVLSHVFYFRTPIEPSKFIRNTQEEETNTQRIDEGITQRIDEIVTEISRAEEEIEKLEARITCRPSRNP
ncbi:MAG: hypothetical protein WCQ90_16000 [Deltaproteobacteria bacterium]